MTVTRVGFHESDNDVGGVLGARDIHLVPGLASPRLDQLLKVFATSRSGGVRASEPILGDTWSVSFAPSFKPAATEFTQGVKVDSNTGRVTVQALPAGSRLRTFTVTGTVKQGANTFDAKVRIHVHGGVADKWITPSSLTVRQGAKGMRFSVLARFDDGVIGDITNWSGSDPLPLDIDELAVHPKDSNKPVHTWSRGTASGPNVTVNEITGEVTAQTNAGFATVNLHVRNGPPIASATAFAAPPWSTPTKLTRIAGPGFTAIGRADVHNVLFLPDGFADDGVLGTDRLDYEFFVRELVQQLNTNAQTRPFDLLSGKFNYFSAWVPSPQAGCSALAEVYSDPARQPPDLPSGHLLGQNVIPLPGKAPAAGQLGLQQLIDAVGLPIPATDLPGTNAGPLATAWLALYGVPASAAAIVDAFPEWLKRNTRVLINERDTAFHMSHNYRPRANGNYTDSVVLSFHPLRMTTADFDSFLRALRDDEDKPVLPVWAEGGADRALVVIVCRTQRDGGVNNPRGTDGSRYIGISMASRDVNEYVPGDHGFDLVPDASPPHAEPVAWATIAHELAHSFGLGDEYGSSGPLPADRVEYVHTRNNLQELASLQTNGVLVAANIKWRWLRLRRAAVLRSPSAGVDPVRPDPDGGGQFLITVGREQAIEFDPSQDVVRLRTRGPQRNPTYSDRLRLIAVHANTLTVRPFDPVGFDPRIWTPGALVVVPVRGPDPDFQARRLGPDLELMHKSVADLINATHNPLNASNGANNNRACQTPDPVVRDQNNLFPAKPARPLISRRIVGLFEGGQTVGCGVFHPTGECIMNQTVELVHGGGQSDIHDLIFGHVGDLARTRLITTR